MKDLVKDFLNADVPVLLVGLPGTGKTTWIRETLAKELNRKVLFINAPLTMEHMYMEIPSVNGDKMYPPMILGQFRDKLIETNVIDDDVIILIDEIGGAPREAQIYLHELISFKSIGKYRFNNALIVATTNDGRDMNRLTRTIINRMAVIKWKLTADDVVEHIGSDLDPFVRSWIKSTNIVLNDPLITDDDSEIENWLSPRTLTYFNKLMKSGCVPDKRHFISLFGKKTGTEMYLSFNMKENVDKLIEKILKTDTSLEDEEPFILIWALGVLDLSNRLTPEILERCKSEIGVLFYSQLDTVERMRKNGHKLSERSKYVKHVEPILKIRK